MVHRRSYLAGIAAAAFVMAGAAGTQAQTKWDLSTVWPEGNFHTEDAKIFAAEVKKATGGAVEILVKAGGQLGFKGPEHLRAVRDGLVPMADILNIQQVGDEPLLGAEGIPFLVGSADELKQLHTFLRPEYDKVAERNNQKILYVVPWPTQYLQLKTKVASADGFKGIKIRVPDKNGVDMFGAIGMAPVLMPWGETVPALASGVVSGVATSSVSGVDGKFWEFLKYVYPTNHTWSSQIVTVNLDAWKKLSPDQRKAIEDTAARLEPTFWAASLKADQDSLARLKEGGMEVIPLSADELNVFRARTKNLTEAFLKRVPAAKPAIEAYLAAMKRGS